MPRKTRCRFLDFVELLKTSLQEGSLLLLSKLRASRISFNWPWTSSSWGCLSRSRDITSRAYSNISVSLSPRIMFSMYPTLSCSPRFASHLGVSGTKGQNARHRSEKKIWQATGKRHCIELFAYKVAKQSQEARATPRMTTADWITNMAPRLCAGRVSDWRIGTATYMLQMVKVMIDRPFGGLKTYRRESNAESADNSCNEHLPILERRALYHCCDDDNDICPDYRPLPSDPFAPHEGSHSTQSTSDVVDCCHKAGHGRVRITQCVFETLASKNASE